MTEDVRAQGAIEVFKETLAMMEKFIFDHYEKSNNRDAVSKSYLIDKCITISSYVTWAYLTGDSKVNVGKAKEQIANALKDVTL